MGGDFIKSTIFDKLGEKTYCLIRKYKLFDSYFLKMGDKLKVVHAENTHKDLLKSYMAHKFKLIYEFMIAGVFLVIVVFNVFYSENGITELERQDLWGEDEERQLIAKTEAGESLVDITVSHKQVSEDTMRLIMEEKAEQLESYILGENKSTDSISSDLNLITKVPDTDIDVYWEIEENDVLNSDGSVVQENLNQDGALVKLKAVLRFKEITTETEFFVNVVQPECSDLEKEQLKLVNILKEADENTVSENSLVLPGKIDNKNVTYTAVDNKNNIWIIPVMMLICIPLLFLSEDEKLNKQKKVRENQILADYPDIVNKLILYLGAGLTIQGALDLISRNYLEQKKQNKTYKRYAYEEVMYVCRKIQGGAGVTEGLEILSQRCAVAPFRKLCMILMQNMKKGSGELIALLHHEAAGAFEVRKNSARKMGEEAGTKLLFPMIMSLGVVIIILIVPAWMTFQV